MSYLRGRVTQVFDAPGPKRPRWTVTDAQAVDDLLRHDQQLNEEANELTRRLDRLVVILFRPTLPAHGFSNRLGVNMTEIRRAWADALEELRQPAKDSS